MKAELDFKTLILFLFLFLKHYFLYQSISNFTSLTEHQTSFK